MIVINCIVINRAKMAVIRFATAALIYLRLEHWPKKHGSQFQIVLSLKIVMVRGYFYFDLITARCLKR